MKLLLLPLLALLLCGCPTEPVYYVAVTEGKVKVVHVYTCQVMGPHDVEDIEIYFDIALAKAAGYRGCKRCLK